MVLKSKLAAKKAAAAAAAGDGPPRIECRSQQSRFHADTLDSVEVDLKDVSISIGERELLSGAHVRLKEGVRYGLVGR